MPSGTNPVRLLRPLLAALVYFILTFAAGSVLGPLREFVLKPRVGESVAVLVEAPLILAVSYFAARWCIKRFSIASRPGDRFTMAGVALAMLLTTEITGSLTLRGLSWSAYAAHLATAPGVISLVLFGFFALFPICVRRG